MRKMLSAALLYLFLPNGWAADPVVPKPAPQATMQKLASDCDEASILAVLGNGTIVKTDDGHMYQIDEVDTVDSSLWLAGDDIVICWTRWLYAGRQVTLFKILNGSDKVDATRLK